MDEIRDYQTISDDLADEFGSDLGQFVDCHKNIARLGAKGVNLSSHKFDELLTCVCLDRFMHSVFPMQTESDISARTIV